MTPEQHTITGSSGEYIRTVWVVPGPSDSPHRLGLFLDAELYLEKVDVLPVLSGLQASGAIPAMTWLFVSHASAADRQTDYLCDKRFARFIAEDCVKWARQRNHHIAKEGNLICGLSLSGLAGAYITFLFPDVFSFSLCQSGSFWWLKDRDLTFPRSNAKFWLSVGDQETATGLTHAPRGLFQEISQIEGVKHAAEKFKALGAQVKYSVHPGSHAAEPWRNELGSALRWLVGRPD